MSCHAIVLVVVVLIVVVIVLASREKSVQASEMQLPIEVRERFPRLLPRLSVSRGEWSVDRRPTGICAGEGEYDMSACYGGTGDNLPGIEAQLQLVQEAMDCGGRHPRSPRVYDIHDVD